jgi:hypothetical protein
MRNIRHYAVLAAAVVALVGSSACAGAVVYRPPVPGPRLGDYAYRNGVREGRAHGARDATQHRSFDYARHEDYRRATRGGRDWDDGASYRRGFVEGYEEGYRQYAPPEVRRGGSGDPRDPGDDNGRNRYPTRGSVAGIHGYRDGYDQGRSDAVDGDRRDPIRARRYREGDNGWDRRELSLEEYKRLYRNAFVEGYEEGYRDSRRRR